MPKNVLGFGAFQVSSFQITDAQHVELNKYTNKFEAGAHRILTAVWISAVWITGRISLFLLILISKWHQFLHVSKSGRKLWRRCRWLLCGACSDRTSLAISHYTHYFKSLYKFLREEKEEKTDLERESPMLITPLGYLGKIRIFYTIIKCIITFLFL